MVMDLDEQRLPQRLRPFSFGGHKRSAEALHPSQRKARYLGTPALRHPRAFVEWGARVIRLSAFGKTKHNFFSTGGRRFARMNAKFRSVW
jgi:hypothetical protein